MFEPQTNHTAETIQIRSTETAPFDVGAYFQYGLELVKQRPGETIGLGFAFICGQVMIQLLVAAVQVGGTAFARLMIDAIGITDFSMVQTMLSLVNLTTNLAGNAILTCCNVIVTGMLYIMWLRLVRGQHFELGDLLEIRRFFIPLILSGLIVGFVTTLGTMACIIPGFILAFGLIFTSLVVIDTGLGPVEAVKACWKLTDGHKVDIFLFMIVSFFINFAGALMCGLGLLVTVPVTLGASVYYYNAIAHPHNAYLRPEERNAANNAMQDPSINNFHGGGGAGW